MKNKTKNAKKSGIFIQSYRIKSMSIYIKICDLHMISYIKWLTHHFLIDQLKALMAVNMNACISNHDQCLAYSTL